MNEAPLLEVRDLQVHFPVRGGWLGRRLGTVQAVNGVSFSIRRGETLGLVGESGCGKSTTGLALMSLVPRTGGTISLGGEETSALSASETRAQRRRMQLVFQDPYSSLNPRHRVADIIRAPLDIHRIGSSNERRQQVTALMQRVGLRPDQATQYPHQFSGGQRQRIGIARALAMRPDLIICDEPVSALDVSVQAQILNLLVRLQRDDGLSYLFISHDLGVVRHISDQVAVMYGGRIVEIGPRDRLFGGPVHPYTELLMRSTPPAHPRERRRYDVKAEVMPSAARLPPGCAFHPRCTLASEQCRVERPALLPREPDRLVACHHR